MQCTKCRDTGYIITIERGREVARKCDCGYLDREKNERQRKYSNIPEAYRDVRLRKDFHNYYADKVTISKAVKTVEYWRDNLSQMLCDGVGLYIYSREKGSGKTLLAAGVANDLIYEHDIPVRFATTTQIIQEIKATWDKDNPSTESQLINILCTIKVLVIDDLGVERYVDWIAERMYHIINERYVNKLATIYTSNVPYNELIYDDRIQNRILERSIMVKFPEESIRRKIADDRRRELEKKIDS